MRELDPPYLKINSSKIRAPDIEARERQHDGQKGEAAPDGAGDIDLVAALGQILLSRVEREGFLVVFVPQERLDHIAELAGLGKHRVDWNQPIIVAGFLARH